MMADGVCNACAAAGLASAMAGVASLIPGPGGLIGSTIFSVVSGAASVGCDVTPYLIPYSLDLRRWGLCMLWLTGDDYSSSPTPISKQNPKTWTSWPLRARPMLSQSWMTLVQRSKIRYRLSSETAT